tara:strand:- start:4923 stop:5426 length:504 start_codon:yes stop_codon:yes gene_type:complete
MNISMKKGLLALAGAVALAGAGSAQAVMFEYEGTTDFSGPGGSPTLTCTLNLTGDLTSGVVTVMNGTVTGPGLCPFVTVDNFNWTGMLSNLTGGGRFDLSMNDPRATVTDPTTGMPLFVCEGAVLGVTYPSVSAVTGTPPSVDLNNIVFGPNNCVVDGTLLRLVPTN